MNATS